jgi:hypothetical protein
MAGGSMFCIDKMGPRVVARGNREKGTLRLCLHIEIMYTRICFVNTYYVPFDGELILKIITLLALFIVYHSSTLYTKSACIIIHGTWAKDENWYQPSGDFFKSVNRCVKELTCVDEVISFSWSGKLGYFFQHEAARDLVKIIEKYESVILIGHSHGVTVGIIASQIMATCHSNRKDYPKIIKFYALGVPVDLTMSVYPDMSVIGTFFNLFSFGDYVQPVNDVHARCFACHERIANIEVKLCGLYPSHSQLHDSIIGKDLLKIEQYFAQRCLGNFENFCCNRPGIINFHEHDLPTYEQHPDMEAQLELDKKARWMMNLALFRSGQKESKSE